LCQVRNLGLENKDDISMKDWHGASLSRGKHVSLMVPTGDWMVVKS
jgi:hypothetical protein